jgi:hypothetical protein
MTDKPKWRRTYDAVVGMAAPQLEALVRTDQFSDTTAVTARTRRLIADQVNGVAARFWHLLNLPAGTDIQRLRIQVGALDREVRRLRLELDRQARQQD